MVRSILWLLLESQLVGVTALSLSAVGSLQGKSGIALSTDFLVLVVGLGDGSHCGIHTSSSESQHEVQGGLLLDVVVGECSAV